ncbi:hypothetical protein [Oceanobacillus timonensis]|uniref:hypothetical protein n=1 Tax=Oceanobacillus timonensis TaxID=1926285 RepID=UPI0009B942A9|nr:hypothetical protein [Oceanobacillus timonensis]
MPQPEELAEMNDKQVAVPEILLDHERRLTNVEAQQAKVFEKLDDMKVNMDDHNKEQKDLLNKLISHHLETKKMNLSSFWKWFISITGAGGLVTAVVVIVFEFFI